MSDDKIDQGKLETLSALVDGELSRQEMRRGLDLVYSDPALERRWERYHLVREVLRGNAARPAPERFARDARAALDGEPVVRLSGLRRGWRRARLPAAGLALAASVAAVAVIGLGRPGPQLPGGAAAEIAAATPPPAPVEVRPAELAATLAPVPAAEPVSTRRLATAARQPGYTQVRWNDLQPSVETRMNTYLVNYSEYAGSHMRGMLPYARIVGYERR